MDWSLRRWLWLAPAPVVALAVFWSGLHSWFFNDDFAWLGLGLSVHDGASLLRALFAPMAQGTIRPFSERIFFLGGHALFGLDAAPFRLVVFATHFANLLLFAALVKRWTGSPLAGSAAAVFWAANSALAQPLSWTSSYNQILWPFFMLCALHAREDGRRMREALFFLAGFGALEMNVVYPALALARDPRRWRSTLPLFGMSAGYTVFHRFLNAGREPNPVYRMFFDPASVTATLWEYLRMAGGAIRPGYHPENELALLIGTGIAAAGFLLGLLWALWRREWLALYGAAWFLICLGPVVPLRNHVSDYYLAVPVAGLALAGGVLFSRRPAWAALPAAAYLLSSIPVAREVTRYNKDRGELARVLVLGVQQATALHPGKILLLTGISSSQYWSVVNDKPFRLIPGARVYLAPGSEGNIEIHPDLGNPGEFVLPASAASAALDAGDAIVYNASGAPLRNVTPAYRELAAREWAGSLGSVVDVGAPYVAPQLGPGWEPLEQGFRWMQPTATLTLGGPASPGDVLFVRCFRSPDEPRKGPVTLSIYSGNEVVGRLSVPDGAAEFNGEVKLPVNVAEQARIPLTLTVSPALTAPGDGRKLGLAFGVIGIRSGAH